MQKLVGKAVLAGASFLRDTLYDNGKKVETCCCLVLTMPWILPGICLDLADRRQRQTQQPKS